MREHFHRTHSLTHSLTRTADKAGRRHMQPNPSHPTYTHASSTHASIHPSVRPPVACRFTSTRPYQVRAGAVVMPTCFAQGCRSNAQMPCVRQFKQQARHVSKEHTPTTNAKMKNRQAWTLTSTLHCSRTLQPPQRLLCRNGMPGRNSQRYSPAPTWSQWPDGAQRRVRRTAS